MYLTRHGNGYRFQRRIPADLVSILGKSPIRLNLGNISRRNAASASRLLVGHLDRLFIDVLRTRGKCMNRKIDPRDTIIAELQAQLAEMTKAWKDTADKAQQQQ